MPTSKEDRRKLWNLKTPRNPEYFSGDREIAPIDFNIPLKPVSKPGNVLSAIMKHSSQDVGLVE